MELKKGHNKIDQIEISHELLFKVSVGLSPNHPSGFLAKVDLFGVFLLINMLKKL